MNAGREGQTISAIVFGNHDTKELKLIYWTKRPNFEFKINVNKSKIKPHFFWIFWEDDMIEVVPC